MFKKMWPISEAWVSSTSISVSQRDSMRIDYGPAVAMTHDSMDKRALA